MKLLITGATGFIGGAVARGAIAKGHQVLCMTRSDAPSSSDSLQWVQGSMASPPLAEIAKFEPDACVHCAWIATPGVYLESPENEDLRRNSAHFLSKVRDIGVSHITALGTCIEYAMTGEPLDENSTPLDPKSPYAKAKAALCKQLMQEHGNLAWARIFYPYGRGEDAARLCSSLIRSFRKRDTLRLKTPRSTKDYIHIRDVAAALLVVVETRFKGMINIGTGTGIAVEDLARQIATQLDGEELVECAPNPLPDPLAHVVANANRLKSLGWSPKVTLENGLEELIASCS